ncbi:hypothetical protein AK812_SmicGene21708 [Symbiodinium microadriaticum]|uniref:Uncharacterized protein n=1 Tax=Symbiodinium microadriaticum TaxID=2951 RepID=A0A1Q9DLS5_SYMMI|nr:hypothetical protein AK812_SmicGene21708 [Symbiodinium microadriaticum]
MQNARASYEESGRHFKGKVMSELVNYRPGNDSRDFFKKASDGPLRYYDIQAYNARIVMMWLATKCQQAALNAPVNSHIPLHATALQLP